SARMNSVIDECSFCVSIPPKICSAVWDGAAATMPAQSISRGPSTACRKYALASSRDEMANALDIELCPRPAICGKTNHIQWLVLRPRRSSSTARLYVPPASWAATKRPRLYGSSMLDSVLRRGCLGNGGGVACTFAPRGCLGSVHCAAWPPLPPASNVLL